MGMAILLFLCIFLFCAYVLGSLAGLLARRKGYSALWWFLSGPLGIVVLLFYPSSKNPDLSETQAQQKTKTGNIVGAVLSFVVTPLIVWPILGDMLRETEKALGG